MKSRTCADCGTSLTKRNTAKGETKKCTRCRNKERAQWWAERPELANMLTLEQALEVELLLPKAKR